ncbi:MAG: protein-L-isoaspartate(D-aspartate) O-methyltransferase [Thermodesulfobacteriota bacterium]
MGKGIAVFNKLDFSKARERMIDEQIASRGIKDIRVLNALNKVPRHLFVEEALHGQAYNDYPLPIGERQTISQPFMVALMTEALELKGKERVLEIGTGSGYQAAILAELAEWVYSIERIRSLANRARRILFELQYYNVEIGISDGTQGWKEKAPFQAITVTAGAPDVPQPLLNQLAIGGRLVVPVGDAFSQILVRVIRTKRGFQREDMGGCHFVRLIGKYAWQEE